MYIVSFSAKAQECWFGDVPISGTASDVVGMDSATRFKNTVNDNRIVTPANRSTYERRDSGKVEKEKKRIQIFALKPSSVHNQLV